LRRQCGILPRILFAQETGIVPTMIDEAARAKLQVAPHFVATSSVLEGSGGIIAVLPGKGGKLLSDSGFTVSRARIAATLYGLSSAPSHSDNTIGMSITQMECVVCIRRSNDYSARIEKASFDLTRF